MRTLLQPRNLLVYCHDVAMAYLAFITAFALRLGFGAPWAERAVFETAAAFAAVAGVVYLFTGLYRHVWEYVSTKDAMNVLRSATLSILIFVPTLFFVTRLETFPRSLPIIGWFVLVLFLAGPRLLVRLARDRQFAGVWTGNRDGAPIILVGAGPEAEQFIRAVQKGRGAPYNILGMVTANPTRLGQLIQGVEVLGMDKDLSTLISKLGRRGLKPEKIVVVRAKVTGAELNQFLDVAEAHGCGLARVPPPAEVRDYDDVALKPRPIAIDDILGRPQMSLDREAMAELIRGKRVLVTGAGGSIGAELVRQIVAIGPSHLGLVDHGEYNLYTIDREIREWRPNQSLSTVLADVRDASRMKDIMTRERPDLVFHAAALKHVPLVEINVIEGLMTNALGARNVAEACIAARVPAMVLVSTDKAVNPANVMGAAKRIAEMICQAEDLRQSATKFITVRFGNVLGSAGSVVPLFQHQLETGGPLTVTHPDIERYFMTTHEAVELILQASALGLSKRDQGAIYVLDMGAPVKIMDLAKQMIRLAGKTLGRDIDIKITGLRPGEKLYEELFHGQEPPLPTGQDGVLIARPRVVDHALIVAKLNALEQSCRARDEDQALAIVTDLVPEMRRGQPPQPKPHLSIVKSA
ncbi:MAG: nucleoside-diphosphate sugar epimerase/dehydratase [Rhodospirillaceae bacterium]|nr:nucleoside-diphosphate sugar epimerase/dehydratase [Rhodospirillaceae bacterium]